MGGGVLLTSSDGQMLAVGGPDHGTTGGFGSLPATG
jgi:hypothetical protein